MKMQKNRWVYLYKEAVGCSYKEIGRELKGQFIHRLNDDEMLIEVTREFTKNEESKDMTGDQVLAWTKRMQVQEPCL